MRFEWDEDKSRSNRKKHGVPFEAAVRVFGDPLLLVTKDRIVDGERRWHAIGAVETAILLVVHVYRTESEHGEEETVRIISARPADRRERRRYFEQAAQ